MKFLRRLAGILGLLKDESHEANEEDDEDREHKEEARPRGPTKRFSVQVPVPVEKTHPGPLLAPCSFGQGGVQGLRWHAKRLRIDEDGDVADEFLDEVHSGVLQSDNQNQPPKFEVKYSTRPAKVRSQVVAAGGSIHQSVEFKGQLQWV
ncbi:uncharacterized protein [Aristolochia californica]|uniref:uncharacterized protein n=1 Tax=Aristolochia californica TaxID=171875 RepID=UPI0035DD3C96